MKTGEQRVSSLSSHFALSERNKKCKDVNKASSACVLFARWLLRRRRYCRGRYFWSGCFSFGCSLFCDFAYRTFSGNRTFRIVRYLERRIAYLLADSTRPDALGTNANGLSRAVCRCRPNVLQIRQKRPPGDTGYFRTNPAEILCLPSRFDTVTETTPFPANFTDTRHCNTPQTFGEF